MEILCSNFRVFKFTFIALLKPDMPAQNEGTTGQ